MIFVCVVLLIAIVVSDFLKLVATVTTTDIRSRDQLRALVIDHRTFSGVKQMKPMNIW